MVRCMLRFTQVPKEFWAEAVAIAMYILNSCPTRNVCNKTPKKAWSEGDL